MDGRIRKADELETFFFFLNLFFFSIQTDNIVYYTNNLLTWVRRWDQSVKDGSNLLRMPHQDNENNNPTFYRLKKNA